MKAKHPSVGAQNLFDISREWYSLRERLCLIHRDTGLAYVWLPVLWGLASHNRMWRQDQLVWLAGGDVFPEHMPDYYRTFAKLDWQALKQSVVDLAGYCQQRNIRLLAWGSPAYPKALEKLDHPPAFLFCRGNWRYLDSSMPVLVGTRRASLFSVGGVRMVLDYLDQAKPGAIASGMAWGVDAYVHWETLRRGVGAVAILGQGLDVLYPQANARLWRHFDENPDKTLLVSEFFPGNAPLAHQFPRRNRILAALAAPLIVMESGRGGGALITSAQACDLGKEAFYFHHPFLNQNWGNRRHIRDGLGWEFTPAQTGNFWISGARLRGRLLAQAKHANLNSEHTALDKNRMTHRRPDFRAWRQASQAYNRIVAYLVDAEQQKFCRHLGMDVWSMRGRDLLTDWRTLVSRGGWGI